MTDKARVAPMAQSLSQRFAAQGLRFAQYTLKGDAAEAAALAALGVRKPPALLALKGTDPSKAVLYEGARAAHGGCRCAEQAAAVPLSLAAAVLLPRVPWLLSLAGLPNPCCPAYRPRAGDLKAPRIADWIRQQLGGLEEASGRTEAVEGKEGKKGKAGKAGGAEANGKPQEEPQHKEEGQQGKKESVPANIPQVWGR